MPPPSGADAYEIFLGTTSSRISISRNGKLELIQDVQCGIKNLSPDISSKFAFYPEPTEFNNQYPDARRLTPQISEFRLKEVPEKILAELAELKARYQAEYQSQNDNNQHLSNLAALMRYLKATADGHLGFIVTNAVITGWYLLNVLFLGSHNISLAQQPSAVC